MWSEDGPFSKGYIDNTQNLFLMDGASPYLRNCRLDGNSIIQRPWHWLFATLTAGSYPKGIGGYLRTTASNDRLVVRHNIDATHKLSTITTAGVTADILTDSNISSDARMFFQNVGDVIYCMNWVDYFGKLNGTTYTVPSTGVSNFAPSFSVIFNSSHWASGWSTNANKVYKSVWDNYEDFNSTGSDTFTFGEALTWLCANNEALFYFTKSTISVTGTGDITDTAWTITYVTRPLEVKEGSVNHASIVSAGNMIYFLTPSNKLGIVTKGQSNEWFEVQELSERKYAGISTILSGLAVDQSDSFGYYLPKENIIKWFVKSAGSSINDICIIYDIGKDAFLVDDGKYFFGGLFFKGANYTISMVEPKVYQDEYGNDDEDGAIGFEYRTKEYYISDPTYKKILRESRTLLDINELASLTQEIWIDEAQADTKTVDSDNITISVWGIGTDPVWTFAIGEDGWWEDTDYQEIYILRTKGNLNKIGRKVQFRYTNQVVGSKVRLKNISAKVEIKPELSSNLTT